MSAIELSICIFKARLGGEICLSDVVMHKGYCRTLLEQDRKTFMSADLHVLLIIFILGGYNVKNAAKCWTYLTSVALNQSLSLDIPEHEVISAVN